MTPRQRRKKTFTLKCAFERSSLLTKSKLLLPNYKSRHFLLSKLIVTTFPPPHKQSWCNQRGCDISLIYSWTGSDFIFLIYSGPQTWFSEPQFSEILHSMNELQLPFSYFTLYLFIQTQFSEKTQFSEPKRSDDHIH